MTSLRVRNDLAGSALADLADDLDELHYLAQSQLQRLRTARLEIERKRSCFRPRTLRTELAQLLSAEETFGNYEHALGDCSLGARRGTVGLHDLRAIKAEYADLLRLQFGISAALIAGSDWQSPAFAGAGYPTAGRHTGEIAEHIDDYKRDRHPDARSFEESYLREYVDAVPGARLGALMTTCGMAAFTTILRYLCSRLDPTNPVVATRGMYHECRELLVDGPLRPRIHWVDDGDTAGIADACRRLRPSALFLDSMCNSKGIAVPDITRLLQKLAETERNLFVVIDNTCAPVFCSPFNSPFSGDTLRVLVFESLTKYAQFGFDRVAAGIIIGPQRETKELDRLREHLGTNVADVCVAAIPQPNRALFARRLRRIERNAGLLAQHCAELVDTHSSPLRVVYPGLPTHDCHGAARRLGFYGGCFALSLHPEIDTPAAQGRLVSGLIRAARRHQVNLVAGASFGLNVTRVYRTATEIGLGPFVRIAAGAEDRLEIENLKGVFTEAVSELSATSHAMRDSLQTLRREGRGTRGRGGRLVVEDSALHTSGNRYDLPGHVPRDPI